MIIGLAVANKSGGTVIGVCEFFWNSILEENADMCFSILN